MRGLKRSPGLVGLGVLLVALVVFAGHARADVASDQSGTLLVFPKVIADGTRDTLIQIGNTSNSTAFAHCYYINAAGACSDSLDFCDIDDDCPPAASGAAQQCVHVCRELDFDIALTPQQPTIWPVAVGRSVLDYPGLPGFPPAITIPPPAPPFVGELKCVQVDRSGFPSPGNALKGEATILPVQGGSSVPIDRAGKVSQYDAISVVANFAPALVTNGGAIRLDFGPNGFNPCPAKLIVPHFAEGAVDDSAAVVHAELSLVACTELLEHQVSTYSNANLVSWDEFEDQFSAPLQFGCSVNRSFSKISETQFSALYSCNLRKTTIRPQQSKQCMTGDLRCHLCGVYHSGIPATNEDDDQCAGLPPNTLVGNCSCTSDADCPGSEPGLGCVQSPGLLGVVEEFYQRRNTATAAINVFNEGSRPGDVILLPPLPGIPAP